MKKKPAPRRLKTRPKPTTKSPSVGSPSAPQPVTQAATNSHPLLNLKEVLTMSQLVLITPVKLGGDAPGGPKPSPTGAPEAPGSPQAFLATITLVETPSGPVDPGYGRPELPGWRPVDPGFGVRPPVDPGYGRPELPGWSPGGPHPSHPIYLPPGIWPKPPGGGSGEHPEHPIVLPPDPDEPPGTVWPPLDPPVAESGYIIAWVPGQGYRYIKVALPEEPSVPPDPSGKPPTTKPVPPAQPKPV